MALGRTIALYGQSGTGKTTQAGQHAKYVKKTTGKNTKYVAADLGGHDSIDPLIRVGVVEPHYFNEGDDPWVWINDHTSTSPGADIGLVIFDSGTSMGEALLASAAKHAAAGLKVGAQNPLKFTIPGTKLTIGANNESQYGVVQSFLLDAIWKSTWLARKGVDVLWTFGEHRAENPNDAPIVGPKLAGKALTGSIPKWFKYTLRLVTTATEGSAASHKLLIQEQPELGGVGMSFGNSRYPLEAVTPLPAVIEPASIVAFWEILEQGQKEADEQLRIELGL